MAKTLTDRRDHHATSDGISRNENTTTTKKSPQTQIDLEANDDKKKNTSSMKKTTPGNNNNNNNNNAKDNDHDNLKPKPPSSSPKTALLMVPLQIANIMAWYWTNGMNGIAMQAYAGQVSDVATSGTNLRASRFWITLVTTSWVTCLQLLLGALIGRIILYVLLNRSITWEQITSTRSIPLASLHAAGSLATNLGFMYGKASLVQVIKLLEPFETLLLSQLLFREGNCSIGIVSSMTLVVGAAMSLLKLQSTPPLPQAIIFALLSGLTLSTRNVLQRKHHHTSSLSASASSSTTAAVVKTWSKLEKSVVQFTQLSFYSGCWMAGASLVLWLLIPVPTIEASWQVFLWHPLYNIFSMITLGFCSALTHSLLNAGKRVFAICMAMLWFAEGFNASTLSGLLAVALGGIWYSWESKQKPSSQHGTTTSTTSSAANTKTNKAEQKQTTIQHGKEMYKLVVSISTLVALFAFHHRYAAAGTGKNKR